MDTRRIQTSIMLDPDVKKKLKKVAANDDDKISNIVNRAVRSMFQLNGPAEPPKPAA